MVRWSLFGLAILCCSCTLPQKNFKEKQLVVRKKWVKKTFITPYEGFRKSLTESPYLTGNKVIVGNGIDGVTAYDISNGRKLWQNPVSFGVESGITGVKERLFYGGNDGFIYSVNANTGEEVWKSAVSAEVLSQPLLNEGVLYVGIGNNSFIALDAATGKAIWSHSQQETTSESIRGISEPLIYKDSIIVGFNDGSLLRLNLADGKPKWRSLLNKNKKFKDIDSKPVLVNGRLFVMGYDDHLYSLNPENGKVLWKIKGGGFGAPSFEGNTLYYSTSEGIVKAVDTQFGKEKWIYKDIVGVPAQPVVYGNFLLVSDSNGELQFIDKSSGKKVHGFDSGRGILARPTTDDKSEAIYFISNQGYLYALSAKFRIPLERAPNLNQEAL